jgi:hypothetical protein
MPLDLSVVQARRETVPGTYLAPAPATDSLLVFDYEVTPMESEEVRSQLQRTFAGGYPSTYTAIRASHAFSVELCGSGTIDAPPFWMQLLRASLYGAPTIVPAASAGVSPISAGDGESYSLIGFRDNARHRARMCRGNAVFTFEEKRIPFVRYGWTGLIEGAQPMDATTPTGVVLPTVPAGVECSLGNTVITLDGFTLGVRRLEIDLGMKTEFYSHTGARAVIFGKDDSGDRRSVGGNIVFEMPDPVTRNFFSSVIPRTRLAFNLLHGTAVGNRVTLNSSNCVLGRITYSVEQNRLFANCPLQFLPSSAGNDELIVITS